MDITSFFSILYLDWVAVEVPLPIENPTPRPSLSMFLVAKGDVGGLFFCDRFLPPTAPLGFSPLLSFFLQIRARNHIF